MKHHFSLTTFPQNRLKQGLVAWLLCLLFLPFTAIAQHTTSSRSLGAFEKVSISGGFEIMYLEQGNAENLVIESDRLDANDVETEIDKGVLKIKIKKGAHQNHKTKLMLTYKSLSALMNSGSTDIKSKSPIKATAFSLAFSGSGGFKGQIDVEKLDIAISGSSNMILSGTANEQDIAISGSGNVDANALKGESASVAISGSGVAQLSVKGKVNQRISGSGAVIND